MTGISNEECGRSVATGGIEVVHKFFKRLKRLKAAAKRYLCYCADPQVCLCVNISASGKMEQTPIPRDFKCWILCVYFMGTVQKN